MMTEKQILDYAETIEKRRDEAEKRLNECCVVSERQDLVFVLAILNARLATINAIL